MKRISLLTVITVGLLSLVPNSVSPVFSPRLSFAAPILAAPTFASPTQSAMVTRWERSNRVPVSTQRHHAFRVPMKMKPRVKFWIDVFSKYTKYHAVMHHRMHPHIIFDVLDFTKRAKNVSDNKYAQMRKNGISARKKLIIAALNNLAAGRAPKNTLEQHIARQMSPLGGGTKKYRDVVKNGWIRSQRGIRQRYREALERSGRYMHILEKIFVVDYGLPVELTRLPFVESSFDYKAYSSVGAAGIWQFMPATGKLFKLKVSHVYDERRDVTAATGAAARYLIEAYKRIGVWPLALTSYNHGVYGVLKKIKKLGTRDSTKIIEMVENQPFGFASQNFYPEFLAALEIYDHPQRYFPGVVIEQPVEIARRKLTRGTSVSELTKKLGVSKEQLQKVNYALHSRVWSGRYSIPAGYTLNVPINYASRLASLKLPQSKSSSGTGSAVYGGLTYKVRRGDSLGRIAKRYGTRVSTLKQLNGLRSDVVRIGQTLVVKGSTSQKVKTTVVPSGRTYRVRSGDTLFDIARAHRTTVAAIKSVNNISGSRIRIGQVLKMPGGASSTRTTNTYEKPTIYRVKKGDSLYKISSRYGVSIAAIRKKNNLRSSKIAIGQKLVIP